MRLATGFVLAALCGILAAISLEDVSLPGASSAQADSAARLQPKVVLLPGDLVFRRGLTMASRVVRAADADSLFSHVGIVDVQGKSPRVIHSAPAGEGSAAGGVISEPLSQFLSAGNATMAGIYRLKNEESAIPVRALDLAREYLYRAAPFDGSFDLADQEAVYCTEFIWAVYAGAGVDLSAGRFDRLEVPFKTDVDFILPSTLTKSADLESIEILTFEEW